MNIILWIQYLIAHINYAMEQVKLTHLIECFRVGRQSGLVGSELDSRPKDREFESRLIQHTKMEMVLKPC